MTNLNRLPPLATLRVFESTARNLSFSRAAEELNVTTGAVSQHIRQLEAIVGQPLFRRMGRHVLLTDAGQAALPLLREGFDKLAEAAAMMRAPLRKGRVAVSVAPSFASKWLVPRMDLFHQAHPDVEVWISADMDVVDFAVADVDLAIRYGPGHYADVNCERLLSETVLAVCNPGILDPARPILHPSQVMEHPLIHDMSPENDPTCPDWKMWLKARGVDRVDLSGGLRFNQSSLVIEAAASGRGIALAKRALAQTDLDAGRLVALFAADETQLSFAYHLVWPRGRTVTTAQRTLMDWLRREAGVSAGHSASA